MKKSRNLGFFFLLTIATLSLVGCAPKEPGSQPTITQAPQPVASVQPQAQVVLPNGQVAGANQPVQPTLPVNPQILPQANTSAQSVAQPVTPQISLGPAVDQINPGNIPAPQVFNGQVVAGQQQVIGSPQSVRTQAQAKQRAQPHVQPSPQALVSTSQYGIEQGFTCRLAGEGQQYPWAIVVRNQRVYGDNEFHYVYKTVGVGACVVPQAYSIYEFHDGQPIMLGRSQ